MKTYIMQTDAGLPRQTRLSGCYVMACLFWAQIACAVVFSVKQLNEIIHEAIDRGMILENMKVMNSAALMTLGLRAAGNDKMSFVYVGKNRFGRIIWEKDRPHHFDALIERIGQPAGSVFSSHFRGVDETGRIVYDYPGGVQGRPEYTNLYALVPGTPHGF